MAKRLGDNSVLIMGQVRATQLRRWSDPAYCLHAPIAGGTERPSEEGIRDCIRKRLASGQLKATDGMIVRARSDNGACAACECEIDPAEAATLGYRYLDGEYHGFHVRCVVLWEEERRAHSPGEE